MAPVVVDLDIQDILNISKERHQLALGLEVNICQCIVPHPGELVWLTTKLGAEVNKTVDAANYCLSHNVNNGVGSAKLLKSSFAPLLSHECVPSI